MSKKPVITVNLTPPEFVFLKVSEIRSSAYFFQLYKQDLKMESKGAMLTKEYVIQGEVVSAKYPLYKKLLIWNNYVKYSKITCEYCKQKIPSLHKITLDHYVPRRSGGKNKNGENLLICCYGCNQFKGGIHPLKQARIFAVFNQLVTEKKFSQAELINRTFKQATKHEFIYILNSRWKFLQPSERIYFMKLILDNFSKGHLKNLFLTDPAFKNIIQSTKRAIRKELAKSQLSQNSLISA